MIINTTSSYCCDCVKNHPAIVEKHDNTVFFKVKCPLGEKVTKISSDAELFLDIRRKNSPHLTGDFGHKGPAQLRLLEVTNACNFKCPICFAESGEDEHRFLSVEKAVKLAHSAKLAGATIISLTGGEPTMHPELPIIIQKITEVGLRVNIVTNGFRLKDMKYTRLLKESGLYAAHVQFDTFDFDVHEKMRGNRFIPEKIQALENSKKVQLRLGINTTVTSLNIHEVGKILEFGIQFAPQFYMVVFQAVAHIGRYKLLSYEPIYREQIIHALIDSKVIKGLSTEHFWPMPTFYPWQLGVHPDCVANLFLVVDNSKFEALDNYVNIANFYRRFQRNRGKPDRLNKFILPLYYLLLETKPGKRTKLLRFLKGLAANRGKEGTVLVMIGEFLSIDYQDVERLKGCASCYVTTRGHIPGCVYYRPDQEYKLLYEEDLSNEIA